MKTTILLLIIFLVSCSEQKSAKESKLTAPSPESSIQEIQQFYKSLKDNPNKDAFTGATEINLNTFSPNAVTDGTSKTYPSGDFYIMLGIGSSDSDTNMTRKEYQNLWAIMQYVNQKQFRVLVNTTAETYHLRNAVQDDNTAVILWSSHGNENNFYNYAGEPIPHDIFQNKGKNLKQFILSACYGRISLDKNYNLPNDLLTWSWSGLTNSDELIGFLKSDQWSIFNGMTEEKVIGNMQCLLDGEGYFITRSHDKQRFNQTPFTKLDSCLDRISRTRNNLVCLKDEQGFKPVSVAAAKNIPNMIYNDLASCHTYIGLSNENFSCSQKSGGYQLISTLTANPVSNKVIEDSDTCIQIVRDARNNLACSYNDEGDGFRLVDASTGKEVEPNKKYQSYSDCLNQIR